MAFQDIPGNDRVKKILKLALGRRRVPNSLLFAGPKGVGKHRLAVELAKALNCLSLPDDACGECDHCLAIPERLPDVFEVALEKTVITIEQIREIKEIAYMRPMTARTRVIIIDPADKLHGPSANAFLKVLEEPPLSTYFILIAENAGLLAETIRSRCQTLDFLPVSDEDIVGVLRSSGMDEDRARILALLVRGNLERARAMSWDEVQEKRRTAWELFRSLVTRTGSTGFLRLYAFPFRKDRGEARDELAETLELFASFARDGLVLGEGGGPGALFNPDYEPELRDCLPFLGPERTVRMLGAIEAAEDGLGRSFNLSLLATSLYSQMTG